MELTLAFESYFDKSRCSIEYTSSTSLESSSANLWIPFPRITTAGLSLRCSDRSLAADTDSHVFFFIPFSSYSAITHISLSLKYTSPPVGFLQAPLLYQVMSPE